MVADTADPDPGLAGRLRVPDESRALLASYQRLATDALLRELPTGEPKRYLYDLLPAYPRRSAKALRPALCLASCRAFGGRLDDALPFAVALELLHTAFLVHDDIQDGTACRRGGPALQAEHGVALALNAGDALAVLSMVEMVRAATALGRGLATTLLEEGERTVRETLEGQALDLGWQRDNAVGLTTADYLRMAAKKTAWYTCILPLRIGALLGSGGRAGPLRTLRFGWFLGVLLQLGNDLAGLRADDDIRAGKRTLPLIHLLERCPAADRRRLLDLFGRPECARDAEDIAWVRVRMHEVGSVAHARACLHGLAGAALREAERTFADLPASEDRQLLYSMVACVLETAPVPVEEHQGA